MPDSHRNMYRSNFQTGLFIKYAMERMMCITILFLILAVATVTDLLFDKIYNEWILIGAAAGLSYAVWQGGGDGLIRALLSMAVPIVLLYPFLGDASKPVNAQDSLPFFNPLKRASHTAS